MRDRPIQRRHRFAQCVEVADVGQQSSIVTVGRRDECLLRDVQTRDREASVRSEQVPDVYSVTYRDPDKLAGGSGMPADIEARLAPYRRLVVG